MKKNLLLFPVLFCFLLSCSPSTKDLYWKADQFMNKRQWSKAIAVYDRILKKNSKMQDAFYFKAYCYREDSNYTQALHFFDVVLRLKGVYSERSFIIEMNPDGPVVSETDRHQVQLDEVYFQIGVTKYYMDSLLPAYQLFQHCIKNDFRKVDCLVFQGLIWVRADSVKKACRSFEEARKMGDTFADTLLKKYCSNPVVNE